MPGEPVFEEVRVAGLLFFLRERQLFFTERRRPGEPVAVARDPPPSGPCDSRLSDSMLSTMGHRKVLVVEDDHLIREAIAEALDQEGFVVVEAANGREALDKLHQGRTSLVLLDLMMPVMDGVAFARALRAQYTEDEIPIVVISADGNPQRAAAVGARGFLAKPFDIDALLDEVASVTAFVPGIPP